MVLRQRLTTATRTRKAQAKVKPFSRLPLNFEEIARRVSPATAFRTVPEMEALRSELAANRNALLAAQTLAYFVVLTEFVIRDAKIRDTYADARSDFYNLQRRKPSLEDPVAMELAKGLRQQHTVQGIRKLQIQLFTAYPVAAGFTDVEQLRSVDKREFAVLNMLYWKSLLPVLVTIYPDQITDPDQLTKIRRIEPRTPKEVADLLRKRLINFAGRTPQTMATAIERSLVLFADAQRTYQQHSAP